MKGRAATTETACSTIVSCTKASVPAVLRVLLTAALLCASVQVVAAIAIEQVAAVASNNPPVLPLLSSYTYRAQLSPAFAVFWSLDSPAAPSAIRLAVTARTRGYVGLGIAEVGAMVGTGEREGGRIESYGGHMLEGGGQDTTIGWTQVNGHRECGCRKGEYAFNKSVERGRKERNVGDK